MEERLHTAICQAVSHLSQGNNAQASTILREMLVFYADGKESEAKKWSDLLLDVTEPDRTKPPCLECGAMTEKEAKTLCICAGDKDHCHGADLWP